jgi:hypothetical protein
MSKKVQPKTVYQLCTSIEEFTTFSEDLIKDDPTSRYTIKYKNNTGDLVLSCTNDKYLYKYRSSQQGDVKLVEKANNVLFNVFTKSK